MRPAPRFVFSQVRTQFYCNFVRKMCKGANPRYQVPVSSGYSVAVIGATGAVGREFLNLFEQRSFPVRCLSLYASERNAGTELQYSSTTIWVENAQSALDKSFDFVFLSAGAKVSRELAPKLAASGATCIDNSSAFRMDPNVPLVVPEINFHAVRPEHKIIANPNCTAIILLMAVAPLMNLGHVERIIVSTYQSASGAGSRGMSELVNQTRAVLDGQNATPEVFPHPYAFNLFSHNTPIGEDGLNEEESKVVAESQKILGRPDLKIFPTCVRVPVLRAHTESIYLEFTHDAPGLDEARLALQSAKGIRLVDDRESNHFPMPHEASGSYEVLVGRLRHDASNPRALALFASGDQLLKGAALNAVQIAEALVSQRELSAQPLAK